MFVFVWFVFVVCFFSLGKNISADKLLIKRADA